MAGQVRVYIAMSLDGFIAGPNDELDWLGEPDPSQGVPDGALGFDAFMSQIGAMVMGRGTYDVISAFDEWFYGELPILVPTHRPLVSGRASVTAVSGPIEHILDQALKRAGGKDVYLDGGAIVRAGLDAGRVDDLVVTVVPIVLGAGKPLFAGTSKRHPLELLSHDAMGAGMVQLHFRPQSAAG